MCGLWGAVSSTLSHQEIGHIETLGILASLRGTDSTGMIVGSKRKKRRDYVMLKDTIASGEFLQYSYVQNALRDHGSFLVVGHCRAATVGDVDVDNAHPFKVGHILGVHNGTALKIKPSTSQKTDSFHIFETIATKNLQTAVDKIDGGAYALVWVDNQANTLNFLRNTQRQLWFLSNTNKTTLYWSSEKLMLDFLREREGKSNFGEPALIPEDTLLTFDLIKGIHNHTQKEVKPSTPAVVPFAIGKDTTSSAGTGGTEKKGSALIPMSAIEWENAIQESEREEERARKAQTAIDRVKLAEEILKRRAERQTIAEGTIKEEESLYKAFQNIPFGLPYAVKYLANGCSFCGAILNLTDKAWWFSKTDYVCPDCKEQPLIKEMTTENQLYESSIIGKQLSSRDYVTSKTIEGNTVH